MGSTCAALDCMTNSVSTAPGLEGETSQNSYPVGQDVGESTEIVSHSVAPPEAFSTCTDVVLWNPSHIASSRTAEALLTESLSTTGEMVFDPIIYLTDPAAAIGTSHPQSVVDVNVKLTSIPGQFDMSSGDIHTCTELDMEEIDAQDGHSNFNTCATDHKSTFNVQVDFASPFLTPATLTTRHCAENEEVSDRSTHTEQDPTSHRTKRVKFTDLTSDDDLDDDDSNDGDNDDDEDEDYHDTQGRDSTIFHSQRRKNRVNNQHKQQRSKCLKKSQKSDSTIFTTDAIAKQVPDFSGLFGNADDLLVAAKLNKSRPNAPAFRSSNRREDALKDLLQNIKDPKLLKQDVKAEINRACQMFSGSHKKIKPFQSKWHVFGMRAEASLPYHQLFGVAFLRRLEKTDEVRGGILADAPGLGKTVMMLSNIMNSYLFDKPCPGSTLVIGSRALVAQWYSEIHKHCDPDNFPDVVIYDGFKRTGVTNLTLALEKYTIVLATYDEVKQSHPDETAFESAADPITRAKLVKDQSGPLHRVSWARVVLDESHGIKNHRSKTAQACIALKGKMKWAISGTPVMNKLEEFYSYFSFLGMPQCETFSIFKERYLKSCDDAGVLRLKVALDRIMLRRLHSHTIFGAKLLDLPGLNYRTVTVMLSKLEQKLYNHFAAMFRNSVSKASGKDQKRHARLKGFTYMRLLTGHFLQVPLPTGACLGGEDFADYLSLTSTYSNIKLTSVQERLQEVLIKYDGKFEELEKDKALQSDVQDLNWAANSDEDLDEDVSTSSGNACVWCNKRPPDDPFLTSCKHIYCKACLSSMLVRAEAKEKCHRCHETITSAVALVDRSAQKLGSRTHKLVAGTALVKERIEELAPLGLLPLSAKTSGVIRQVESWLEEDSSGKIIIFTQFHGMITILSLLFSEKNWGYCSYHGGRAHQSRQNALWEFEHKQDKKILLMSLKAGGVGLNLTMANRALLVDPWFNGGIEFQAYARIHRIGQERETTVVRLVVADSYDQRILQIQGSKAERIDGVMESIERKSDDAFTDEEVLDLLADTGVEKQHAGEGIGVF